MGLEKPSKPSANLIKEHENSLVFSYMTLRNLIGFSGLALPLILLFTTFRQEGDKVVQGSISDYYYTNNGDVFVVIVCTLSVFLLTYRGYSFAEWLCTTMAAVGGLGLAFSPTVCKYTAQFSVHFQNESVPTLFGIERHLLYAGVFFISLAIMSLVFFPRSANDALSKKTVHKDSLGKTTQKGKRNRMYRFCGWFMLACLTGCLVYIIGGKTLHDMAGDFPVIFVLETAALFAFAASWLTKGETLWPDGEHYFVTGFRQFSQWLKAAKGT